MEKPTKITDQKLAADAIKEKMVCENLNLQKFVQKYGKGLKIEDVETMLEGICYYTDKMNKVATDFLGIDVDCKKNLNNYEIRFRINGINKLTSKSEKVKKFTEKIQQVFLQNICKNEINIEKKLNININTFPEFKEKFEVKYPFDMENFIEKNKINDNFILVKEPNDIGISGFTKVNYVKDVRYVCIYINTSEPLGRQNYTFCHELYHLYIDKCGEYNISMIDDIIEEKAEEFASFLLINRKELIKKINDMSMSNHREITFEQILKIQEKFNASFIAVICVIKKLKKRLESHTNAIKKFPIIPGEYFKYKNKEYFEELEIRTVQCRPQNVLNSPTNDKKIINV